MPHVAVGRALRKLMNKDGFVALPFSSDLKQDMPADFVPDEAGVQILYQAIFKRNLPQNRREIALEHIQAIIPFEGLYLEQSQNEAGRTKFEARFQGILKRNRTHDEPSRPYVSLLDSNEITADLMQSLKTKPVTVVLTDYQICHDDTNIPLNDLTTLFATHPEHRLMLTIDSSGLIRGLTRNRSTICSGRTGNRLFSGKAEFVLKRNLLPENMHHLILTNPKGNVQYLDNSIMWMHKGLRTVECHSLNQVTRAYGRFLDSMPALEFVDLSGLRNLQDTGTSFLSSCPMLRTVKFPASSKWHIMNYEAFLGCTSLESLDLSLLSGLTNVKEGFLKGCSNLSDEEIAKIMQFLADRDIQWRPDMNS
ncbi:MAG: hypothetical protein ACK5O7_01680 [Holosporales bacterium]